MIRSLVGFSVAILLALPLVAADDKVGEEQKRLYGTWQATAGTWEGRALTAEQVKKCAIAITPPDNSRLVPTQITLSFPDKLVGYELWVKDVKETRYQTSLFNYTLILDPMKSPKSIGAWKQFGIKGVTFSGIYELDGDTLRVCFNMNPNGKQPENFKTPGGKGFQAHSGFLVLTLKRKK
ncbi:MAG: TIGR03067 domain-containing protein [Planctomycetia bacterium]|nr:TIGR03067 domain-containing protein [Planctomycetia bacterium]